MQLLYHQGSGLLVAGYWLLVLWLLSARRPSGGTSDFRPPTSACPPSFWRDFWPLIPQFPVLHSLFPILYPLSSILIPDSWLLIKSVSFSVTGVKILTLPSFLILKTDISFDSRNLAWLPIESVGWVERNPTHHSGRNIAFNVYNLRNLGCEDKKNPSCSSWWLIPRLSD